MRLPLLAVLLLALVPALAPPPAAAAGRVWWGAYVDGGQYGFDNPPWDMRGLERFERNAGRRAAILHFGLAWYDGATPQPFPLQAMRNLHRRGVVPLIDWSSWDRRGTGADDARFALRRIIAGDHDRTIRRWALAARRYGRPFFLRFDHEMNGDWYPWSERRNGNRPGEYRRAWRHVHAIFDEVGARNVTWVWSPNVIYREATPLRRLYPGGDVVDWVAVDGYNWGSVPGRRPDVWRPLATLFGPSYRALRRLAPSKPIMIAEVASTEHGGSKARWTRDALRTLPRRFPAVRAVLWFNWRAEGYDWPIESSAAALSAFRAGIAARAYAGPPGRLPIGPIRPPA